VRPNIHASDLEMILAMDAKAFTSATTQPSHTTLAPQQLPPSPYLPSPLFSAQRADGKEVKTCPQTVDFIQASSPKA